MDEAARRGHKRVEQHEAAARRLTEEGRARGVATKCANLAAHPSQCRPDVALRPVAGLALFDDDVLLKRKKSKWADAVIDADDDRASDTAGPDPPGPAVSNGTNQVDVPDADDRMSAP